MWGKMACHWVSIHCVQAALYLTGTTCHLCWNLSLMLNTSLLLTQTWKLRLSRQLFFCSPRRVLSLLVMIVYRGGQMAQWCHFGLTLPFRQKYLNPQFMNQVLEVGSSSQAEREELLTLCPMRALCAYVTRTQPPRGISFSAFCRLWNCKTGVNAFHAYVEQCL